jgi:hypothetical protein
MVLPSPAMWGGAASPSSQILQFVAATILIPAQMGRLSSGPLVGQDASTSDNRLKAGLGRKRAVFFPARKRESRH